MELNERNLTEYLNGLEEQASTFMILVRKLNNDPHASMGFLRLQDLQEKIHSKELDINLDDISDPEDSDLKP
jgi:hypothetical protein